MSEGIKTGDRVTAHLRITLADGTVAESTFDASPLEFVVGGDAIHPNLGRLFLGLTVGDERRIELPAERGFGVPRDELVQTLPRQQFSQTAAPQKGQVIEFLTPDGESVAGTVLKIEGDTVLVDFNPPLAGRDLCVELQILDVTPQT
jgi:FKBP-type peptidyl-prolyl cis-trans isomerase 2